MILSPLFPRLFVKTMSLHLARLQLESCVTRIKLSGSNSNADGVLRLTDETCYICDQTVTWGGLVMTIEIEGSDKFDGWIIRGITDDEGYENILWKCPFGSNSWIPPKDHWEAIHEEVSGTPKIEYC
jgi:hypothetical protein